MLTRCEIDYAKAVIWAEAMNSNTAHGCNDSQFLMYDRPTSGQIKNYANHHCLAPDAALPLDSNGNPTASPDFDGYLIKWIN